MIEKDIDGLATLDVAYNSEIEGCDSKEVIDKLVEAGAIAEYMDFVNGIVNLGVNHGFKIDSMTRANFLTDDIYNGPSEMYQLVATHENGDMRIYYTFRLCIFDQTGNQWILGHELPEIDKELENLIELEDGKPLAWKLRDVRVNDSDEDQDGTVVYE